MARTSIVSALILALAAASPASAGEQTWQVGAGYVIRSHDLDLSRGHDRERLLARVETASRRLCSGIATRKARRQCTEEAAAQAHSAAPPAARAALADAARARTDVRLAGRW